MPNSMPSGSAVRGAGASDLYISTPGTNTSVTVASLPVDGRTLYVRLWSLIAGGWQYNDYSYTAYTAPSGSLAVITSPPNHSILTSSAVTFQWSAGAAVQQYVLWIGSTAIGSNDLYTSTPSTSTSATVNSLPVDGRTLYVRLWSLIGSWQYNDYTYTAYTASAGSLAVMTSPPNRSTLTSSSATFQWSTGSGVQQYVLWIGSGGTGFNDLYVSTPSTGASAAVTGLPTDGRTLYVRLWSLIGSWQHNDYTYTAYTGNLAVMSSPANLSTLTSFSATFQWTTGTGVKQDVLWIGSAGVGSSDLYVSTPATATSAAVTGLPANGETLYVRLWSLVSAGWAIE